MNRLRVALLYNLQHPIIADPDVPSDVIAGQDRLETVDAVADALSGAGHTVIPLEADHSLLDTIRQVNPDICFNMARGREGADRASYVPALLEMLHVPYTGSGVMSHAVSQNKATAKRIWSDQGLPTASFQVMHDESESLSPALRGVPLFVKPLYENASTGIGIDAIAWEEAQVRRQIAWIVESYHQPALVERYLPGREFSVAILGNADSAGHSANARLIESAGPVLGPEASGRSGGAGSVAAHRPDHRHGYRTLPVLETVTMADLNAQHHRGAPSPEWGREEHSQTQVCPASVPDLAGALQDLAVQAFEAVSAVDMARVDFRCDASGAPFLLEIDTLPTLDGNQSRFVRMAEAGGLSFAMLINAVLGLAARRYRLDIGLPEKVAGEGSGIQGIEVTSMLSY
ncbi:MAG: hypothetical protein ACK2UO_06785 [Caldilineaceae bacterium]